MTLLANPIVNVRRRESRARNFPKNTCPASRHLHIIADCLSKVKRVYPMLQDEPEHCAGTMYSVLESLWTLRTDADRLAAMVLELFPDDSCEICPGRHSCRRPASRCPIKQARKILGLKVGAT